MNLTTESISSFQAELGLSDRTVATHLGMPKNTYTAKRLGSRGFTPVEAAKLRGLIGRIRYAQQQSAESAPALQAAPPQDAA